MHEESVRPIFSLLSPQLAADTAFHSNAFIKQNSIGFFKHCPRPFLISLTIILEARCFAEKEQISTQATLHIMKRGISAIEGRILTRGSVWGEDVILQSSLYTRRVVVHCLSYTETLSVGKFELNEVLEVHPKAKKIVKRAAVYIAMRRAMVKSAQLARESEGVDDMMQCLTKMRLQKATDLEQYTKNDDRHSQVVERKPFQKVLRERVEVVRTDLEAQMTSMEERISAKLDSILEKMAKGEGTPGA